MLTNNQYDIAIIGGGIIGVATAMALVSSRSISLVVLEAEKALASHQTGNNSGVIHSGLYYKPDSLKARNCVAGREALYRFCDHHQIPHEKCGKVVVATDENELPALQELERRGRANGISGLKRLGPDGIHEYEPHVSGISGLFVPDTGITDFTEITRHFAEIVRNYGGDIKTSTKFHKINKERDGFVLDTSTGEYRCRNVINCGGLHSDRIARKCGLKPGLQIIPFRGEYYKLIPEKHSLVNNLIYPVPDPRFPFLGVHFTRMIHGGVEAGPNAVLALKRFGYRKFNLSIQDMKDIFWFRGFWSMASQYWKMGMGEIYRSFSKRAFVRALQRLIPEVQMGDIQRCGAGVRAQAVESDGRLVDDFRILQAERMIHVLNAPSPAATASISIGETIAKMAERSLKLP